MPELTPDEQEAIEIFDEIINKAMAVFQEVAPCGVIPTEDQEKLYDLVAGVQAQVAIEGFKPESHEFASAVLANLATAYNLGRKQSGGFW